MKIALVHDFLVSYGGAERVLETLALMYPEAPIYTLLADDAVVRTHFPGRRLHTSFLQKFPQFLRKRYQWLLPLYPVAVETLDLRDYDLVLSSSGAWSKGVVTRLRTRHVAYIHSPMRYVWDANATYLKDQNKKGSMSLVLRLLFTYLRIWDREAAERPDILLANSEYTKRRIEKYYRKQASVVYPPVSLPDRVASRGGEREPERKHFLVVSRLTKAKKIDAVITAFNKLGFPLVVVGEGKEYASLVRNASSNVVFAGAVSDEKLAMLYRGARALLVPSEEDFGMAAAEALSFGTPVLSLEYGGIREILTPGVHGETFRVAVPEIIAEAVTRFLSHEQAGGYDQESMRAAGARFSEAAFREGIRRAVEEM